MGALRYRGQALNRTDIVWRLDTLRMRRLRISLAVSAGFGANGGIRLKAHKGQAPAVTPHLDRLSRLRSSLDVGFV